MIIILVNSNNKEMIVIPKDAIRFRIIANSNDIEDQRIKYHIKEEITPLITGVTNDKYEASMMIKSAIPSIKEVIEANNVDYDINYGNNYFPEKEYRGVKYPAGNYESLVITLGDGLGDNWWCVLFPPLCLLEAQESDLDDYEYTIFIKDIINKF